MATKLDWMKTCLDGVLPLKSHESLITWSYKITLQFKITISNTTVLMAAKLGWMITYLDGLLPIQ